MKNRISQKRFLKIGYIFFTTGIVLYLGEMFLHIFSVGFGGNIFLARATTFLIACIVLLLENALLPILSYINLKKNSKKLSIIIIALCILSISFSLFTIYVRLNNLQPFLFNNFAFYRFLVDHILFDSFFGVALGLMSKVKIAMFFILMSSISFLCSCVSVLSNRVTQGNNTNNTGYGSLC